VQKDSFKSWVVILMVGVALTISQVDRMLLSIAAPSMLADQHMSATALGVLLSSFAWTYTAMLMPAGWLVDRFGAKRVLAIAFVCWSLACAGMGLSTAFFALIGFRLLLGMAEAPLYPVAHATMAQAFSERRRGLATAIYSKGASLGPAIGAIVGSWLLLKYGWSEMFLIVGLSSLIFVVPWLKFAPATLNVGRPNSGKTDVATIRQLLRKRAVWGVSIGYFGFLYLYYIYVTWLPTYLAKARGLSTSEIAWMSSVPFLVSLIAGPASGFIADGLIAKGHSQTLVRKSAIAIGLVLGAMIIPAAFAPDAQTAAIFFVIALAGQAVSAAAMLALPSAIAPNGHAGFVGGFQQMMGGLGGIVSPIVTGVLYDRTQDFTSAILCAGSLLVLAAVSFLIILPKVEQVQLSDDPARPSRPDLASPTQAAEGGPRA
jgi:ACS family D-galactonate transporter-like MFS transporter